MRTRKHIPFLLIISVLAISVTACSLFSRAAGVLPQGSQGSVDDPPGSPTQGTSTQNEGFSNLTEGLEDLESYRAAFSLSLDGTGEEGNPVTGRMDMLHELNRKRLQEHVLYNFEGALDPESLAEAAGNFESFTMDQMTFVRTQAAEGAKCTGFPTDSEGLSSSAIVSANDLISGIENPRLEKSGELMNGVLTNRYSFKRAGFYFGAADKIQGKYWMAADGNYVVRLTAEATGSGGFFGIKVIGQSILEYNLTDINTDFEISLPDDCESQKPPEDIPLPDGAANLESYADLITYQTEMTQAEAVDFYRGQMPPNGWTAGEETTVDKMVIMLFTKESRRITITVSVDESGSTSVLISPANP